MRDFLESLFANFSARKRAARSAHAASNASRSGSSPPRYAVQSHVSHGAAKTPLNEEHFRRLVDGIQDYSVLMLDPEGIILSWNTGAQRINGYAPNEIIGQHFSR